MIGLLSHYAIITLNLFYCSFLSLYYVLEAIKKSLDFVQRRGIEMGYIHRYKGWNHE